MLKIFMVLTMAAIIVSGVFGWKNREEFVADRLGKQDYKNKINSLNNDNLVLAKEIKKKHEELEAAWASRDIAQAKLDDAKKNLSRVEQEFTRRSSDKDNLEAQKKQKEDKLKEAEEALVEAIGRPISLDQVEQAYAEIQKKVEDQKQKRTLVTNELNVNTETRNNRVTDRKLLQDAQRERDEDFQLNVLTAKVTNVRNEVGLLEFNAGSDDNITGTTDLMVVRSGTVLCRITLVKAPSENKSLAEIKRETLLDGVQVQVGDLVVVRTPKE